MTTPRERLSAITHGDRPFHDPLDPAVVDEVLDGAGVGPGDRVLVRGARGTMGFALVLLRQVRL